jgi:hypothetical protein
MYRRPGFLWELSFYSGTIRPAPSPILPHKPSPSHRLRVRVHPKDGSGLPAHSTLSPVNSHSRPATNNEVLYDDVKPQTGRYTKVNALTMMV